MTRGWYNESVRHKLASKGISTSFDKDKKVDTSKPITVRIKHKTSYRNFRPKEFLEHAKVDEDTISRNKYIEARRVLNEMESGRFSDMLYDTLNMFSNLDSDEKKVWANNNPELTRWMGLYGFLNGHKTFFEYTDYPSIHEFEIIEDYEL